MHELLALNAGDLGGADSRLRQQLIQEFFFHLVGAAEFVADFTNQQRQLGMALEHVSISSVADRLAGDPVERHLRSLYVNTRGKDLPGDPYSDDGLLFRIWNYRHQVTHRADLNFIFALEIPVPLGPPRRSGWRRIIGGPLRQQDELPSTPYLRLDPRVRDSQRSDHPVNQDLKAMLELVERRCHAALAAV